MMNLLNVYYWGQQNVRQEWVLALNCRQKTVNVIHLGNRLYVL